MGKRSDARDPRDHSSAYGHFSGLGGKLLRSQIRVMARRDISAALFVRVAGSESSFLVSSLQQLYDPVNLL